MNSRFPTAANWSILASGVRLPKVLFLNLKNQKRDYNFYNYLWVLQKNKV